MELNWILMGSFFLVALLYSSVGHGGASGYIALLTLAGFAVEEIRPFVLVLNIMVSLLAFYQFFKAGYFRFGLTWPFVVSGIPLSFIAGSLHLKSSIISLLLAVVLIFSAIRFFWKPETQEVEKQLSISWALFFGGLFGFFAGITGTGGGIFLTPLLILSRWAIPKKAAATSALFIFLNSVAGLGGYFWSGGDMGLIQVEWIIAAYLGGLIGATLGSRFLSPRILQWLLAFVLLLAAVKLLRAS